MRILKRAVTLLLAALMLAGALSGAAAEAGTDGPAERRETGLEQFIVLHGSPDSPRVALTMDDCTDREIVWKAAELCRKHGITMTFFPNGVNLHPKEGKGWRGILEAGCEIGSHGEDHMALKYQDRVAPELMVFQQHLDETLGEHYPVRWFRPPYGALEDEQGSMTMIMYRIRQCGYDHALLWNVSYMLDARGAFEQARNGSIFLFHATEGDLKCLEGLIPLLLEAGFQPVTVSELFGFESPRPGGEKYVYDRKTFRYPRPDPGKWPQDPDS